MRQYIRPAQKKTTLKEISDTKKAESHDEEILEALGTQDYLENQARYQSLLEPHFSFDYN